jgi:hypothetical protein
MTAKRAALMGGMGYPVTETPWGMPQFKSRLEKIGFEVLLVNWKKRQDVYNFMHGFVGFRLYAGDSLGAGSAGQYPGDVKGDVDYAAGFQPSDYDARTTKDPQGNHIQIVASNIVRAHCVYDPHWVDTLGLGHTQWVTTHGAKTILSVTKHPGAHPDDWGYSQDLIFNEVVTLTTPAKKVRHG